MSLCQRCFKASPLYDCILCKGYFCLSCDKYIHSFQTKKNHTRRIIDISETMFTSNNYFLNSKNQEDLSVFQNGKNINDNSIIKETIPIYDSNIGKTNIIYEFDNLKYESGPYIDLDGKYLQGTTNIANKIEELSSNISNTKINLNERIDFLHENIHKADENNKNEIININSRNLKELNDMSSEKDREIKYLQSIIEKQKEKINELKEIQNGFFMFYKIITFK